LRWKFQDELRQGPVKVSLTNVVVTHPDYDHYGGLLDVFSGKLKFYDERTYQVEVENFYHSGLARFAASPKLGQTTEGEVAPFPNGSHGIPREGSFITELLDGKDSFRNPPRELSGTFAKYAELVGQVPHNVRRLSYADRYLPGYAPGQSDVIIYVLGPILESFGGGQAGLRAFESDSKIVNGHSVILRLDYGQARILLTGDLNLLAQQLLLSYHAEAQFAVDVMKACHHGSEDIYLDFLRAVKARATVVSSGDNEDYSHPRPAIIGASGHYGREARGAKGEVLPPLVYSTELARSVKLDYASAARVRLRDDGVKLRDVEPKDVEVLAGDWTKYRSLRSAPLSTDLVYGLVNVRTDGQQILCATMLEKGNDFDIKVFKAGVDV
jgi:hypothetical protein